MQNENPFRIRAYRNAAWTLQGMAQEVRVYMEWGKYLQRLPGIGKDLAAKIEGIVETGRCSAFKKLQKQTAPGLGPRRVRALYDELDIHTPGELLRAARNGRLSTLHREPTPAGGNRRTGMRQEDACVCV